MRTLSIKQHRIIQWIAITLILSMGAGWYYQVQVRGAQTIVSEAPTFQVDLKSTIDLQSGVGSPTFTRATTASVTDFEGLIKTAKSGEARFEGARRVENLMLKSEDTTGFEIGSGGITVTNNSNEVLPPPNCSKVIKITANSGNLNHLLRTAPIPYPSTRQYAARVYAKKGTYRYLGIRVGLSAATTNATFDFDTGTWSNVNANTVNYGAENVGNGWWLLWVLGQPNSTSPYVSFTMTDSSGNEQWTSAGTEVVYISGMQAEEVTGQANKNMSEYVSVGVKTSAPYHGANVDGVKYFTTYNGNTVASNVVTEATGAAIPDATLHGYLNEGARTNLALQSETLDTTWSQAGNFVTITPNAAVSPDGKLTADKIIGDNTLNKHRLTQGFTATANSPATFSVFLKAAEHTQALLYLYNNTDFVYGAATVNLSNGTLSGIGGSASIITFPNGWYRVTITGTPTVGPANVMMIYDRAGSTTGDGTSGIYAWGAQTELASFASSYIPTTTTSVTRNADNLNYPVASNLDNTRGTSYAEATFKRDKMAILSTYNGSIGGEPMYIGNGDYKLTLWEGTSRSLSSAFSTPVETIVKLATSWGGSTSRGTVNGVLTSSGFSGSMNFSTTLYIGRESADYYLFGTIRNVKIWKKALSDTQLTNLTGTDAVAAGAVKKTAVGSDAPTFQADLKSTLDLQSGVGSPTFTRATTASVTDFEGLVKTVKSGEARFEGARRVENLETNTGMSTLTNWAGSNSSTITLNTPGSLPPGATNAIRNEVTTGNGYTYQSKALIAGNRYVFSTWVYIPSGVSGTAYLYIFKNASWVGLAASVITQRDQWVRVTLPFTAATSDNGYHVVGVGLGGASIGNQTYSSMPQLEDVTGQANQNPSEYVSVGVKTAAPYHGANVDGVKYFTTQNGNTVASNVVTEATGAAIPDATLHGYLSEGSRTNLVTYSEDIGDSHWQNATLTRVADSAVSPAGTMTADSESGMSYIYQAETVTESTTYTFSYYTKLGTATQNRYAIYDETHSAWITTETVAAGVNASTWTRVTATFTTPVGCVIARVYPARADSGTLYLWGAQLEVGAFASSYIPTTTASVTRSGDMLRYPTAGNILPNIGSTYAEIATAIPDGSVQYNLIIQNGATGYYSALSSSTGFGISDGTLPWVVKTVPSSFNVINKVATKWNVTTKSATMNGLSLATGAFSGSMPDTGYVYMGGGGYGYYTKIRNVKIWKKALSDTQLTNLTSATDAVSAAAVKKTTVNTQQNNKATNGLVGLWSFNGPDVSGTTAYDRSGSNNSGTMTNGPALAIGKVGASMRFDGVDDSVSFGELFNNMSQLTVAYWVKIDTLPSNGGYLPVTKSSGSGTWRTQISTSGQFHFAVGTTNNTWYSAGTYVNSSSALIPGIWYHVVASYDGQYVRVYINGNQDGIGSQAISGNIYNATPENLSMGQGESGIDFMKGSLDEVRVYNRALSSSEVWNLYNLGK